jgi:molecular chaperone GrpE
MLSRDEIDDIAERFRAWLVEANEELDQPAVIELVEKFAQSEPASDVATVLLSSHGPGLLQMTESFTALRHELKLQTKGLRGLHEEMQSQHGSLDAAVREFQSNCRDVRQAAQEAAQNAARPLILSLIDLDESVSQAVKTVTTIPQPPTKTTSPAAHLQAELQREFERLPKWKRMWLNEFWDRVQGHLMNLHRNESIPVQTGTSVGDSLAAGLRILQSRIQRALTEANVERVVSLGQPVNPHEMRVVEVVRDEAATSETVIEEIRAGYRWNGQLLRAAEVRATKP